MTPIRYRTQRISISASVGPNQNVDTTFTTDSSDERVVGVALVDLTGVGDLPFSVSLSNDGGTFIDPVSKTLLEFTKDVPQTMQPLENQPVSARFLPVNEKAEGTIITVRIKTPAVFSSEIICDVIFASVRKPLR